MNTLKLDNNLFLILSVFFLVIWIYIFFFYYYWTIKERDSKQKKLLLQSSYYVPFVTILKIKFKKTEVENFYFEQMLPFFEQKKISWKLFLTFFSSKNSTRKMQLNFARIITLGKKNAPVPDLILHFKIGHFSQKYLLHFVKITHFNVITVTFTNWIDN